MATRNALTLLKAEQKELQANLNRISQAIRVLGGEIPFPRAKRVARKVRKAATKRKVSAATRAKMRAAHKKRWAAMKRTAKGKK